MKQTFAKAALLVSACLMGAMSLPANAEALEKYRVAITDLVLSPSLSASAAKTVSLLGAVKKETFRSGESETRTSKLKRIRTC